jgi:hypothetical protein
MKAMDVHFAATHQSYTVKTFAEALSRHALSESARELSTMVSELRAHLTGKASPEASVKKPPSTPGRDSQSVADASSSSSESDGGTPGSSVSGRSASFRRSRRTTYRTSLQRRSTSRYSRSLTQSEMLLLMETSNLPRGL